MAIPASQNSPSIQPLAQGPFAPMDATQKSDALKESAMKAPLQDEVEASTPTGAIESLAGTKASSHPDLAQAGKIGLLSALKSAKKDSPEIEAFLKSRLPQRPGANAALQDISKYFSDVKKTLAEVKHELKAPEKLRRVNERIASLEGQINKLKSENPKSKKIAALEEEKAKLLSKQEKYQQRTESLETLTPGGIKRADLLKSLKATLESEVKANKTERSQIKKALTQQVKERYQQLDAIPLTHLCARIDGLRKLDSALASLQAYKSAFSNDKAVVEKREKIQEKIAYLQKIVPLDPKQSITHTQAHSGALERFRNAAKQTISTNKPTISHPLEFGLAQRLVFGSDKRAREFSPGVTTGFKMAKLGEGYQLERNDPLHRPWQAPPISAYVTKWKDEAAKAPHDNPTPPFFTWLETQSDKDLPEMYHGYEWGVFNPQTSHGIDIPFNGYSVTYYTQEQQRQAKLTVAENGKVQNAEKQEATTSHARTEDSGPGFGTFAIDEAGQLFTGSHRPGNEYHSSLVRGDPVRAAGEIRVENGQLLEITNKTGHYKTSREQLISVLKDLQRQGYDLSKTTVRLARVIDNKKEDISPSITIYDTFTAQALLQNPNSAPTSIHIRVANPHRAPDLIAKDITNALQVAKRETNLPFSQMRLHMFGEMDVWGADGYPQTAKQIVNALQLVDQKIPLAENPIQISALQLDNAENEKFSMSRPLTASEYLRKER